MGSASACAEVGAAAAVAALHPACDDRRDPPALEPRCARAPSGPRRSPQRTCPSIPPRCTPTTTASSGGARRPPRVKLLGGVADVLRRALAPGETIRYVARGVRYSLFEHVFGGAAVAAYTNMTALVLTDRRLLLVQIRRSGKPADIKNEVPLSAIHAAKKGFTGLGLQLADGTKLKFVVGERPRREAARRRSCPARAARRSAEPSLDPSLPRLSRARPGPRRHDARLLPAGVPHPVPGSRGGRPACRRSSPGSATSISAITSSVPSSSSARC